MVKRMTLVFDPWSTHPQESSLYNLLQSDEERPRGKKVGPMVPQWKERPLNTALMASFKNYK